MQTIRFLRGTVPAGASTETARYGLQEDGLSHIISAENFGPHKTLVVHGTFAATWQFRGSNDKVNWTGIGSAVVDVGNTITIEQVWRWHAILVSSYVSGAIFAALTGFDIRAD